MRLSSLSPESQQRIAVFVPLIALALSLFVVYPAWGRYNNLKEQLVKQRQELTDLKNTPLPDPGPVPVVADDRPTEAPQFLDQVRTIATAAGCKVTGFDISPSPSAKDGEPFHAVRAKLDIAGQYYQVRRFLVDLSHAPRLYVVTDFALLGGAPDAKTPAGVKPLHATVEIERYLATPTTAQKS